jgi:hypothetical protein
MYHIDMKREYDDDDKLHPLYERFYRVQSQAQGVFLPILDSLDIWAN